MVDGFMVDALMVEEMVLLVLACLDEVLLDELAIGPDTALLDLPEIDSITIAALIEATEQASGAVLAPERIVPATFASPRVLAQALIAGGGTVPSDRVSGASDRDGG